MKRIRLRKSKRGVFLGLIISFASICVSTILSNILLANKMLSTVEANTHSANMTVLQQMEQDMSARFREVEQLGNQIAFHGSLPPLYDISENSNQFEKNKLIGFSSDIFLLKSGASSSIYDVFVYLKASGTVVGPGRKAGEKMYYSLVSGYQELSYTDWRGLLINNLHQKEILPSMTLSRNNREVITYIQSLPYACGKESLGELVIQLDAQTIREKLVSIEKTYGGCVYLYDNQNRLIIGQGDLEEEKIGGILRNAEDGSSFMFYQGQDKMLATGITAVNGWKYLLIMPYGVFMEEAFRTKKFITTIVICFFVAGIAMSVLFAYRNYRPLKNLVHLVSKETGRENEYDLIYRTILNYRSREESLNEIISSQEKNVRANYLSRVLHGFAADFEKEALRPIGIDFTETGFYVALVQIETISEFAEQSTEREWASVRFILANVAGDLFGSYGNLYSVELDRNQMAFLINFGDMRERDLLELKALFLKLIDIMRENLKIGITVGMSGAHGRPEEISSCYQEAQKALDYRFIQGKEGLILYSEQNADSSHFYYPLEIEMHISGLVKAGDYTSLQPLLCKVFQENLRNRNLSLEMGKYLCVNITSTIFKLSDNLSIPINRIFPNLPEPFSIFVECASLAEMRVRVMRYYEEFCAYMKGLQSGSGERTVLRVKESIQKNYADPLLGLNLLADQTNLTPQYLSGLFKKQTGENLSDYITGIRIERACSLLKDSRLTIGEIAVRVGYATGTTLIKLFKKRMGVTPGKFREEFDRKPENEAMDQKNG